MTKMQKLLSRVMIVIRIPTSQFLFVSFQ